MSRIEDRIVIYSHEDRLYHTAQLNGNGWLAPNRSLQPIDRAELELTPEQAPFSAKAINSEEGSRIALERAYEEMFRSDMEGQDDIFYVISGCRIDPKTSAFSWVGTFAIYHPDQGPEPVNDELSKHVDWDNLEE